MESSVEQISSPDGSVSSYFGDTFLFQTHSSGRENTNVKIKVTVMFKNKMNIFTDKSMNRNT